MAATATMLSLLRSGRNRDLENVIAHPQPNYVRPPVVFRMALGLPATTRGLPRTLVLRTAVWRADAASGGPGRRGQQPPPV